MRFQLQGGGGAGATGRNPTLDEAESTSSTGCYEEGALPLIYTAAGLWSCEGDQDSFNCPEAPLCEASQVLTNEDRGFSLAFRFFSRAMFSIFE